MFLACIALLVVFDIFIFIQSFHAIFPTGKNSSTDLSQLFFLLPSLLITVGVIIFLLLHDLRTEVDESGIRVSFRPYFTTKKIFRKEDLSKEEVRKYSPIKEFGGWGYRLAFGGKAYSISGKYGLQLEFKNGTSLLIGTRKPEELEKAIAKWRESKEEL